MENNFLYCFDKNYINQAQTSINSLLNNVSSKINLFIICDSTTTEKHIKSAFLNHKFLEKMKTYIFDSSKYKFPKLDGAHVTEATYYRIFIDEILTKNTKTITYLDADVICLNDPLNELNQISEEIVKKEVGLAAFTEGTRANSPILFNKLKLKNNTYFNAGVLVINYDYWIKKSLQNELLKIMENRNKDLIFWDQDLLNIYFDGDYLEFKNNLNFNFTLLNSPHEKEIEKNVIFLHYSGKEKPWNVINIVDKFSNYYQHSYLDLNLNTYHIEFKRNKKNIKGFLKIIFYFQFLKTEYPLKYIYLSLKSFIKNGK